MKITSKNKNAKFFPTPKFLNMRSAGLDISDRSVRFLELKIKDVGFIVSRFDMVSIPEGVIVSGDIKRPDDLKAILKKFRRKNNFDFVSVSLPEEKAYIEKMQVPNLSGDELLNSIMFKLEEYVPIPASNAVVDYIEMPDTAINKKTKDVMVYVLPNRVANAYADMFLNTGIIPTSFEIEAQSLSRAVMQNGDNETLIIVDFGRTRTGISIVCEGILCFTATLGIGGDTITKAIEKEFLVNSKKAYEIKNKMGMTKSKQDEKFFRAILPTISILRDEINKIYIYWHTHYNENKKDKHKIEKIILCGGGANLRGLTEYLSISLKCKTVLADPWINVNSYDKYIPEIKINESFGYATVIGLALKTFE